MTQCLFLTASRVEPTPEELIPEQESSEEASNGFIEDNYDAQKITLQVISEEPEETDDSYSDDEALDNQNIDIQVPQNIENPNRVIGRGRPSKRCYKSSIETEQKRQGTSSRGSYKYEQCGKVGHNAAYHKLKGKGREK
ncbi:hypothetical protein C2G38_2030310 [Gigaspora rosea]|uniref:Uncharacterized protein n=1 Tax=Gigaspora rosea TaxID=44941 RepID=A0A397VYB2_9GLOM|nr:hypothetical protein C2G38_2030310 [Gigaspora rosea]